MEITQDKIKELLHYDPMTGVFRWRFAVAKRVKPWDVAGCLNVNGYAFVKVGGKSIRAHRLAWLYMTGKMPQDQVDHINGCRADNSWSNLREATNKQNTENGKTRKHNTSGFNGVTCKAEGKKWRARVGHNGSRIHLGYFETAEKAMAAVAAKKAEIYTHYTGRDQVNTFA